MAPQTRTQRQATAKKAAATRKRNSARGSTQRTRSSARATTRSARSTARSARKTAAQAARGTARRAEAEVTFVQGLTRQAERTLLIPVGAALTARDNVVETARKYANRTAARRELNRFERRGATALRRNGRGLERQVRDVRRDVERRVDGLQSEAGSVLGRVRSAA